MFASLLNRLGNVEIFFYSATTASFTTTRFHDVPLWQHSMRYALSSVTQKVDSPRLSKATYTKLSGLLLQFCVFKGVITPMHRLAGALAIVLPIFATAQTLTPEEIAAMIDQRMSDLNPYQELLNDPDPARSLEAMRIMINSGDQDLQRMALEYGLLSPNAATKRAAFESLLTRKPIFSIRFDGTDITDSYFDRRMRDWNGTLDTDRIGYWRVPVGDFYEKGRCFAQVDDTDHCMVTINADGIFLTPYYMNARAEISNSGMLVGDASINGVPKPVPFSIRLLD
jgi:hypothetical protein